MLRSPARFVTTHRAARVTAALGLTVALVVGVFTPTTTASAQPATPAVAAATAAPFLTDTLVNILPVTSAAGFAHPGVGLTAADLLNARTKVRAGVEPWASYYSEMANSSYASTTFRADNSTSVLDQPQSAAFDGEYMRLRMMNDGMRASTQAFMYYITGNQVYRANAIKILRIWSNLDPTRYAYFKDSHIHVGHPLYQMTEAAEIVRYTDSVDATYDGYSIAWTAQDTQKYENNLIKPMLATFLNKNTYFQNQHSFVLTGSIPSAIFMDDSAFYAQQVEWFTVNSAFDDYDNGAVAPLLPEIAADDPLNTTGSAFVQLNEMGRDQAHAEADIMNFTLLARIVNNQGTKLDPVAGTVSTATGAVTPYAFLDNRILAGANAFASFMMGNEVPWVNTSGASSGISQAYRGRLFNPSDEVYNQYRYLQGVDVETEAPAVAELHERWDGPSFYNGSVKTSVWSAGDTNPEYWMAFPSAAAGTAPPALRPDSNVSFGLHGTPLDANATVTSENGSSFVAVTPTADGSTVALDRLVYGDRTGYSPIGVRVRTNGAAVLQVSRTRDADPYTSVTLPDTHGQWRYVTYDLNTAVVPAAKVGDNLAFFHVIGSPQTTVDLDAVNLVAKTQLSPPVFAEGSTRSFSTLGGEPFAATVRATDPVSTDTVTYEAAGLPAGAALDSATGALSWSPALSDAGDHTFTVTASDGTTDAVQTLTVFVAADRNEAYQNVLSLGYDAATSYTAASLATFRQADAAIQPTLTSGTYSAFMNALTTLQTAVAGLTLMNPRLADDSLNYIGLATSSLSAGALATLVDSDNTTHSGDLTVPRFTVDFGVNFKVAASAFGIQARTGFGQRSQGTNVYGSNDGTTWTKLTTQETTNTEPTFQMETLPVDPALKDVRYRFFKVQVDHPGVANDPSYPGLFSISEFHVYGDRFDAVNTMTSVSLSSSTALAGRVTQGATEVLSFSTSTSISNVVVKIDGASVAATSTNGTEWRASVAVTDQTTSSGARLGFTIDYRTASGAQADTVFATTDGSTLYESNESALISGVMAKAKVITASGAADPTKVTAANNVFDANPATFADVYATSDVPGSYYISWDFGDGGSVALTRADLLARQDATGLTRLTNAYFEGSNDLTTWKKITSSSVQTLDWQNLQGSDSTPYRYLRLRNTTFLNIAELRLFGTYAAPINALNSLTISSSNTVPNYAVGGDTVKLAIDAKEAITGIVATIEGKPATVTPVSGAANRWTATAVLDDAGAYGRNVAYTLNYIAAGGAKSPTVKTTSDSSVVHLSTASGLITDVMGKKAGMVTLTGAPDPDTANLSRPATLFDQNLTTYTDTRTPFNIIWDFGSHGTVAVARAELIVRQDSLGATRPSNLRLLGSNDLSTWSAVTVAAATGTLNWQDLAPADATKPPTAYRYLRLTNGTFLNVAELRLFGAYDSGIHAPAAPAEPTQTTTAPDAITAAWAAPTDGNSPITGYTVTLTPNAGAPIVVSAPASARSYAFTGLGHARYSVSVVAVNAIGSSPASPSSAPTWLDSDAPATAATLSGRVLTVTATDAVSGIAGIQTRTDGGAWGDYTSPITFDGAAHTVAVRATDRAGNVSNETTVTISETAIINSQKSLALTNQLSVTAGNVHVKGDFSCDSEVHITGNVIATGNARLTNACTIDGDLAAGGTVSMDSTPRVGGSVSAVGAVRYQSTATVGGSITTGSTFTVTDGRSTAQLAASGSVGGTIQAAASVAAPTVTPYASAEFDGSALGLVSWASWMNSSARANSAPSWSQGLTGSPGCTMAPWGSSVNGDTVNVTAPLTVDARSSSSGCSSITLQQMKVRLSADLVVYADAFSAVNGIAFSSADGQKHSVSIIVPGSNAAAGAVNLSAQTVTGAEVSVKVLTPGVVTMQNESALTADIDAGGYTSSGRVALTGH